MKRIVILMLAAGAVAAADKEEPTTDVQLLAEANRAENIARIKSLAEGVSASAGEEASAVDDLLAAELSKSAAACKKDPDALESVITALGKLRSQKGASALKRIAFRKKSKSERAASLQARALVALGALADPKHIGGFEDQTGNRNITVAAGAYAALKSYGRARGKTRRRVAEILVKRMSAEFPRYSPSSGKRVSPQKRARWQKVSSALIGSLQVVCRQPTIASVPEWEEWWKENKKRAKTWRDLKS